MSTVVIGMAASHATLFNTAFDRTKDQEGAHRYKDALEEGRRLVEQARPDAAVVIGSNHFQGFFLDLMPSFTICLGEATGLGDGDTPAGPLPVDHGFARKLAWGLQERDFDLALSLRQDVDHGVTQVLQFFTPELDVPTVPLVINTFMPPLPSLRRCWALGGALRDIIENDGEDRRVAVFASGGLSHTLPFIPKWFDELTEDQQVIVDALFQGASQDEYAHRRGEIMRNATPIINDEWDEAFLRGLEEQDLEAVLSLSNDELEELAGNGGQEIRSWIVAAAMVGGPGRKLGYSAMREWFTGMGVAALLPEPVAAV